MHSEYFGFRQNPFGSTPDPRCIYPSSTHRETLATLMCSYLSNRGFTALIAPPGMGKTTLLLRFLEQIRTTSRTVLLFDIDPEFKPRELVAYILRDLGLKVPDSALETHDMLKEILVAEAKANRKFVLVIDEAQNLSEAALEMVRLMSNFETSQSKLMQIVLAGQTQLADTLDKPSLLQFRQRISYFCRIDPLSKEETRAYIAERLKYADYKGKALFSETALELIAGVSQGTPRIINTLCFNTLSLCFAVKGKQVNEKIVREVIADHRLGLGLEPGLSRPMELRKPTPPPPSEELTPVRSRRDTPYLHSSPPWIRLNASKALLSSAVLTLLLFGVAFAAYRTFWDGAFSKVNAAPHVEAAASNDAPFEVTIEENQSIAGIARRYLGEFNAGRLHQIRALNPWLTNPDRVEAGQKLLLPGPRPARTSDQVRDLETDRGQQ
jgi:type II secretory pathway predicted ATPase ExeA